MPRVKAIYVGNGEWVAPVADIRTCTHPREYLRFDSRFALPMWMYCTACGQPYLHPFHGRSEEEIAEARREGHELWLHLHGYTSDDQVCLKEMPIGTQCVRPKGHADECDFNKHEEDE